MADERRSYRGWWVLFAFACLAVFLFLGLAVVGVVLSRGFAGQEDRIVHSGSKGKIGVVDLTGVITNSSEFMDQMRRYYNDDSIRAIVVHIDSPGGGAAVSQEIFTELNHLREKKKKPVVSSIESVGASGAYYAASATDKIFANSASVVGSVGVIAEWVNYGDLMRWAKLKPVVLQAGKLKSAGDPSRDLTPEERAYMQGLIDDMHHQFIRDVASGRHMKVEQLTPMATGQVWTGEQALPLHIIDSIATYQQVIEQTGKQVGIGDDPTVITPQKPRFSVWDLIFGDASKILPDRLQDIRKDPGFFYLWK
jgi:protease-4